MNFEYTKLEIPNAKFKISPSSLSNFFSSPVMWYREHILGEEGFKGNTSSYLGTIIHAICEAVAKGEPTDKNEIEAFIDSIDNENVDKDEIRLHYETMASAVINEYLLHNMPDKVEQSTYSEIKEGIYIGGTYDAVVGDTLVDYKSAGKKPNTDTIPFNYLIQLLSYAKCLRDEGVAINKVRLVYVVKPTKTLPVRVFIVNKMLDQDDWEMIDNTLELVAESIIRCKEDSSLVPLIFKSMKFK